MCKMQISRCVGAGFFVLLLFCTGSGVDLCNAQETDVSSPPLGEVKLEGACLDYIELFARDGHAERITRPEETVKLPPGEYRLQEVRLRGGYTYYNRGIPRYTWTTVAADKPATLKVGAPLVPTLRVQRQGRILQLSYELRGSGGETYTGGDRSKPPTFAVYKGDKKIASGKFEFG